MRIGEAADQLGVNPKTIESIGSSPKLAGPLRPTGTYGDDDDERLTFIRSAQRLGLSLDKIREVLAFPERGQ